MQPADPLYAQRLRDSFERQAVMKTLGAELDSVQPGKVCITMWHRPELTQQHGFLHAGIVSTALDSACGYAAYSLMPEEAAVLTIEFKVNLISPARGPWFRCEAEVLKPGRTISVVEGRVWGAADPGDKTPRKLVASMSATVMTVLGRDGLKY
ncbi:PaaI family thioesterase [Roseateles sp.]|jgi:uncharacterized protein (TIGR00369 family)|uniref:PaaI family thioesterase n=1 Tax=Roseateles sp. TaxID=1971397 RepID=UPI0037C8047C